MKKITLAIAALTLVSTAALTKLSALANEGDNVMVSMIGQDGADMGYVTLNKAPNGVIIQARLENVPAG